MKIYKDILQIAMPVMAENFLQFLMGMVDSYLVSHLGLVALSGVAVANNLITVFQAIFLALGGAVSVILASLVGRQQSAKLAHHATEALKLTILISLVLGLLTICFGRLFLLFLGAEKAVAHAGGVYLVLVGGTIVFLGLMVTLGAILRSLGKSQLPMYVSLVSNLLNALFSAVAVFVFQAGIVGVAVGTILSRLIACLILLRSIPFQLSKPSWKLDRELIRLALPATGERLMMRAGDVAVVAIIVSLGTAAGNAIGEALTQFNYMPGLGIATATVILVAQARGSYDEKRIREVVRASYLLSLGLMLLIATTIFLFSGPLSGLYTDDSLALEASSLVIVFSLLGSPTTAGTLIYTALWQGLGKAQLPFYATSLGMWFVRIGIASVLIFGFKWGLVGVCLATILDNFFRWLFLSVYFQKYTLK
ncbi:MAG: MATE family efflux transporter [Streptococcus minor]|nr:MATE family efflux transporter [Streptococcus minor]